MFRKKNIFDVVDIKWKKRFVISSMDLKIFYTCIMPAFKNRGLINALSIEVVVTVILIFFLSICHNIIVIY